MSVIRNAGGTKRVQVVLTDCPELSRAQSSTEIVQ
jgi:hypothetical protein